MNFMDLMDRGGPIMWVVLVTACVAVIFLIERALFLFFQKRLAKHDFLALVQNMRSEACISLKRHSPVALILAKINWNQVTDKDTLTREVNVQLAGIMERLEGSLPTIATLGSLLPMLGLLGTVTGMINVFEVIALHGSGDPGAMAGGISQALLTTAGGLAIAIPVIFCHHVLVRSLGGVLSLTEQSLHLVLSTDITLLKEQMSKSNIGGAL
ncbi:MAG: MotA/TolQ/ExbB proton channel family protein [Pseudomonadota bacterium]